MSTAVVSIEGVLGESPVFDVAMMRNEIGHRFLDALQNRYRIALVSSDTNPNKVTHWLQTNGIYYSTLLLGSDRDDWEPVDHRVHQLRMLQSSSTAVELVVDIEPNFIAHAMQRGLTGLLWGSPRPARARADLAPTPIRSWDAIVAEQAVQNGLRETLDVAP